MADDRPDPAGARSACASDQQRSSGCGASNWWRRPAVAFGLGAAALAGVIGMAEPGHWPGCPPAGAAAHAIMAADPHAAINQLMSGADYPGSTICTPGPC